MRAVFTTNRLSNIYSPAATPGGKFIPKAKSEIKFILNQI